MPNVFEPARVAAPRARMIRSPGDPYNNFPLLDFLILVSLKGSEKYAVEISEALSALGAPMRLSSHYLFGRLKILTRDGFLSNRVLSRKVYFSVTEKGVDHLNYLSAMALYLNDVLETVDAVIEAK